MAFLLPENLPTRNDVPRALQHVARLLRDSVDDRATVWCKGLPPEDLEGTEPHLVILVPDAGMIVLGVVTPRGRRGSSEALQDPTTVGAPGSRALVEILGDTTAEIRTRLEAAGLSADRCPVVHTVALPNVTRAELEAELEESGTVSRSVIERILTADDLRREQIEEALTRVSGGAKLPLDEKSETRARAAVNPQIVIHDPRREHFEQGKLVFLAPENGEDALVALDREQERVAQYLGHGYRVLKGVAGSGKTLVLIKRVRFLAERFPQNRYLLTCYNRVLASALQQEIDGLDNVTVSTIDGIAAKIVTYYRDEDFDARCRLAIEQLEWDSVGIFERFDGVFVDEAQDLDETRMQLAWMLLKDPTGDFVVAKDLAQNIYHRNTSWNPPGQTARGRTKIFKLNYRNTKEILEFAYEFLRRGVHIDTDADPEIDEVIIPPESCARKGPKPQVLQVRDQSTEVEFILDRAMAAHEQGMAWGDMAVLCPSKNWQKLLREDCRRRGIPYFFASWDKNSKREVVRHNDKLRCFTFHSAKGLEFPLVFVAYVDSPRTSEPHELEVARSLVYSALTRATNQLVVTVRGEGPIVAELLAASSAC